MRKRKWRTRGTKGKTQKVAHDPELRKLPWEPIEEYAWRIAREWYELPPTERKGMRWMAEVMGTKKKQANFFLLEKHAVRNSRMRFAEVAECCLNEIETYRIKQDLLAGKTVDEPAWHALTIENGRVKRVKTRRSINQ